MNDERRVHPDEGLKSSFFASPVVQASVPAVYAWAITVAPTAFGKGGTSLGQFFALLAITSVISSVAIAHTYAGAARFCLPLLVWGMTLFSSASFLAATPRALASFDTTRGVAGVLGWLLFALASAAPALRRPPEASLTVKALDQQKSVEKPVFGFLIVIALACCVALQSYGWTQEVAERAVLLRVASVALSLLLLALCTKLLRVLDGGREANGAAPTAFRTTLRVLMTVLVIGLVVLYAWLHT